MQNKLVLFIFITIFTLSPVIEAQNQINSPFSRFNLGTIEPSGSYRSQAMGGIGTAIRDNSSMFFSNPASYSSLDTLSFVFDFGLEYNRTQLSSGDSKYTSDDVYFDHLIMGFPIKKGIGFSVGIVPFSSGYYSMVKAVFSTDPDYNPVTGEYTEYHKGDGGFYKVFAGTGIRFLKRFSAGLNLTYLVGSVSRSNLFNFADYYNYFHDESTDNLKLGGVNFEYGLQYSGNLKNDHFLNAGLSFTPSKGYSTTYSQISYRYNGYGSLDTLKYTSETSGSSVIPATIRAGLAYGKENKFTAGIDFDYTQWSKSTIPGSAGYITSTHTFRFGAEYIPDKFSNYSFLRRTEYRIGAHAGNNYLIINGEQIKEIGVSAGLGIPARHSLATQSVLMTNLFFDYTRKSGSTLSNLHTEDIFTVGISLNIKDRWFQKRKYN